jgi:hypothetical protein
VSTLLREGLPRPPAFTPAFLANGYELFDAEGLSEFASNLDIRANSARGHLGQIGDRAERLESGGCGIGLLLAATTAFLHFYRLPSDAFLLI